MTIALARTGDPALGTRSLSAFVIPLRTPEFKSPLANGVRMHRLKNKVGTHGLPTAELELNGTRGWLIGPLNGGVKTISTMLNITRLYSAITSVGSLQRALSIARSYATVRTVYTSGTSGSRPTLLKDLPLHSGTLAKISLLYRALAHLTFGTVHLLGKSEAGTASADELNRLRLLTPAVKAWAADKCPEAMMECMCALGGQGYMEEIGIGRYVSCRYP
jgi:alkylation response protein AidB-like acyl-CoA dehydrogenase